MIATAFADIFHNNCFKNGLLPVVLKPAEVEALFVAALSETPLTVEIDLSAQTVRWNGGQASFEVDAYRRDCLLKGLDEIGLTLQRADAIKAYEAQRRAAEPWLFRA